MRTTLILILAVLIAGCGASNVQVIKPVNGDVKPLLTTEMQKSRCYSLLTAGREGEMIARKSNMLLNECNLSAVDVINRLTYMTYTTKDTYMAESGENHVISKRVMGNKDIEIQTKFFYEKEGGVRGIQALLNDFVDKNYIKGHEPEWSVRALYREVKLQDGKIVVVREGMTREEFMKEDDLEHYKMLNRMLQEKK
jgi:major membrane immunogen (membrane-anchored lipoprotein)